MTVRLFALAFVAAAVFALGPADPVCQPRPPESDARHPSGLAIAARDPCLRTPYEPLALAYDRAFNFAAAHPDDLSYPWDDRRNVTLYISAVTPAGQILAAQWSDLGWAVPIRVRTVGHSFAELEQIKHDLIDIARTGVPGSEAIRFTTGDSQHNRVVVGVQRLTDEVAAAVVARYGTEVVAVFVDPKYGPFSLRD